MHPHNSASKLFCMAYCMLGIPIVFSALAAGGEFLAEAYWICVASLKGQKASCVL